MFEAQQVNFASKSEFYKFLNAQAQQLMSGETDLIANMANLASLIFTTMPSVNWAGFYLVKDGELVLSPFMGKPACVRIKIGKGVCGKAAATKETQVVPNVHEFTGHIACDSASNSEIVVPIIVKGKVIGVLDIDSPQLGRFNAVDKVGLEDLVRNFIDATKFE
jgi:L-methionine (R)-S-oxide reductase